MNLKKYNKTTNSWDIIASGNASGISVTDPRFTQEDVHESVNDVLVYLDDKIELTRRNLSWVVQNGTIGGGGGSGSGLDTELIISNANIVTVEGNNILYAVSESVSLGCLIKQVRSKQKYYVTVTLDQNVIINRQLVYSNTPDELIIKNIAEFTDRTSHSVVITAENDNGIALDPYFLTITESSIKLSVEKNIYNAMIGQATYMLYIVTNKVINAKTALIVNNASIGFEKSIDLGEFDTNQPVAINVNFFDIFPDNYQHTAGSTYLFKAYAQTIIGTEPVNSNEVSVSIVVEDSETLVVLVSNITDITDGGIGVTPAQYNQSGNISFSFTPYLANVSAVYYALRIQRGTFDSTTGEFKVNEALDTPPYKIDDIGIFDADLTNFDKNQYTLRGATKMINWTIPQEEDYLGDYLFQLRCWSDKGTPQTTKRLVCTVVPSSLSLYPTQIPQNSMYAQWHVKKQFPTDPTTSNWISFVDEYKAPGSQTLEQVYTTLNVINTNGKFSGFINEDGQSKLRLANEAYGVINVRPFETDPDSALGVNNWGKRGFTLSMTFKTDMHPFNDRTVFFIGDYDSEGEFSEGIYVGLEDVIWKYSDGPNKYTVSCKIQQNVVTSLDFVIDRGNGQDTGELKIFVNGALNVAREINPSTGNGSGFFWQTNSRMYLACSCLDESALVLDHFADVEFYDIALFTYPLNDMLIVVNSMNSRARGALLPNGSINFAEYNKWQTNNFMDDPEHVSSVLWAGDPELNNGYAWPDFAKICKFSHIPVVHISCTGNTGNQFTKEYYESINPAQLPWFEGCTFEYYDPSNKDSGKVVTHYNASILIQGTSSIGYRSKNIEVKFSNKETGLPELFRPKESWLPESQFTLKADVVDSAHANNASIGKWINDNADALFDKTPPMRVWNEIKPINSGVGDHKGQPHSDQMQIKHTLEGFPVIFLITFYGTSQPEMLGIYSFNLGRASYYNMGMKFLKSFTHDDLVGELAVDELPAFVTAYEEYGQNETPGGIKQSEIYSYEFGQNANIIKIGEEIQYTALFMLHHESILKHVGEFKFNGGNFEMPSSNQVSQHVWDRLKDLFFVTARMTGTAINQYTYDELLGGYVKTDLIYTGQSDWGNLAPELDQRLNLRNAYSYFLICVVFGLVDSLGKNMTLRSWNVKTAETGEEKTMWWPCFYDMDTATGLSNTGEENVAKTAYIDTFENRVQSSGDYTGMNLLNIIYNSFEGGYDTYSSRLWDVLRDSRFIQTGIFDYQTYDTIWSAWRQNPKLIGIDASTGENGITNFMNNCFKSQTEGCGELLYNYDYRVKYLTKYFTKSLIDGNWVTSDKATYGNVQFLHGTRVNYVNYWLNRRATFFDGVYNFSANNNLPYSNLGRFSCGGAEAANGELIVKTNSPVIMQIIIDSTQHFRYFVDENVETSLILKTLSSGSTQITLNNLSEISVLDGLKDLRFEKFVDINLYSLSELNLSNTKTLETEPVSFDKIFVKSIGNDVSGAPIYSSDLRHIDLSNTDFKSGVLNKTFTAEIQNCNKLKTVNISNSCVTSMALPSASLTDLIITNSKIEQLDLSNQAFIKNVDFTGCSKMTRVSAVECAKLETLNLSNLSNLTSIEVVGCPELKEIIAPNCGKLVSFNVSGAPNLEKIDLSGCTNTSLSINIATSNKLSILNLRNTKTKKPVVFTAGFNAITNLDLYGSNITAFQFGSSTNDITIYDGEYVLDLSMFNLTNLNVQYNSLKYIKFANDKVKAYPIYNSTFTGCTNLTRVFGHIDLKESGCFYGGGALTYFTLCGRNNDEVPVEGEWYDSEFSTNVTLTTTSLANMFQETACNMFDVYYILWKASNVRSLSYTFADCKNCVTDINHPLRRDTFKCCGNVTDLTAVFHRSGVGGPLYSPSHNGDTITAYDGLFSYLKSVTSVSLSFLTSKTFYIDDLLFYKCSNSESDTLKINALSSMFAWDLGDNIQIVENTTTLTPTNIVNSYARASKLLRYLPNITSISNTFNNIRINFDTEEYQGISFCPLIAYNTRLTSISGFLMNVVAKGSLLYVFGGHSVFKTNNNLFPRSLKTLNGFIYATSYSGSAVYCPIHNSMFDLISNTLESFGHYALSNVASPSSYSKAAPSLNGPGLNKKFLQEGDELFPLDIFKSCSKLVRMEYLFYGLTSDINTTSNTLSLPGEMFIKNVNLQYIDGCFANMASNIQYKLTGKGFINCRLVSVSDCFNEGSVGKGNKVGGIPYGLFYQEQQVSKQYKDGWSHDDAVALGLTDTTEFPVGSVLPEKKTYTQNLKLIRNTITNMSGALRYFAGTNAAPYSREEVTLDSIVNAGDAIVQNQVYDPREYIINTAYHPNKTITDDTGQTIDDPKYNPYYVVKNPSYSPYLYEWNIYYPDGTINMGDEIENSALYKAVLDGLVTEISAIIPEELYDPNTAETVSGNAREVSRSYICPPDLFRYCANGNVTLNYVLGNTSNFSSGSYSKLIHGIYGRIPAVLFKPLTNATELLNVFSDSHNVTPHLWGTDDTVGEMVPAELFKYNTKLTNVTGIFQGFYIPNNVNFPSTLFSQNSGLTNVSYLFYNCIFNNSSALPSSIFNSNKQLNNISYMLAASSVYAVPSGNGVKRIEGGMFSLSANPNLSNFSGFLQYQRNTKGIVPAFWDWNPKIASNKVNVFLGVTKANIDNVSAIESAGWATGMI